MSDENDTQRLSLHDVIKRDLEALQLPVSASGTPRVLIVEDNNLEAKLLEEHLTRRGFRAEVTTTTDDAIKRIAAAVPFSGAIVDLSLPGGKSGIVVASALRSIWPKTNVAILSGYVDDDILAVCEKHGFKVFRKPVDSVALNAILDLIVNTTEVEK